ncbi:MAG: ribosomal protein L7/L12 [Candidatus Melainabacteria bacterium]
MDLGLKESKDLIDSIPSIVLSDVTSEKAESFKKTNRKRWWKSLD